MVFALHLFPNKIKPKTVLPGIKSFHFLFKLYSLSSIRIVHIKYVSVYHYLLLINKSVCSYSFSKLLYVMNALLNEIFVYCML